MQLFWPAVQTRSVATRTIKTITFRASRSRRGFIDGVIRQMFGVQRNRVSTVAHALQQAGVIKYNRGNIEIMNLGALREASCECYQAVNAHYDGLLNED
jgi:Crp-like helix-turn-helix domain